MIKYVKLIVDLQDARHKNNIVQSKLMFSKRVLFGPLEISMFCILS